MKGVAPLILRRNRDGGQLTTDSSFTPGVPSLMLES